MLLEIDGKIVPNYAATLVNFEDGDVVQGTVVQIDRDEVLAVAPAAEDGRFRVPPSGGLSE